MMVKFLFLKMVTCFYIYDIKIITMKTDLFCIVLKLVLIERYSYIIVVFSRKFFFVFVKFDQKKQQQWFYQYNNMNKIVS